MRYTVDVVLSVVLDLPDDDSPENLEAAWQAADAALASVEWPKGFGYSMFENSVTVECGCGTEHTVPCLHAPSVALDGGPLKDSSRKGIDNRSTSHTD